MCFGQLEQFRVIDSFAATGWARFDKALRPQSAFNGSQRPRNEPVTAY